MSETYLERFDRYYELLKTDALGSIMRYKLKSMLKLMNFLVDQEVFYDILRKREVPPLVCKARAFDFLELYTSVIGYKQSDSEEIVAIAKKSKSHQDPDKDLFIVRGTHSVVVLDWREYHVYQLIKEKELENEISDSDCSPTKKRRSE